MSGVNFPTPLVEAHEAGELVIFVGAGASVPWPSSLPSFMKLVEVIRDESNLRDEIGDLDDQLLDGVLGRIKDDYGVDVHGRIHSHMSKTGSRPSPIHKAIVDLASASTVRIVTTNYDRHLSKLFDQRHEERAEYSAPALPMGDDFEGLVYIHGHLNQERRRLVATDDDFGKAYLTEAWAARFLDRMFAARPVLFVGYSHKDTIMKYLARGLGGRSEKRYAITADSESNLWRQLGITPIQCSYDDTAPALSDWATRASEGLLGHRARVKALVAGQNPTPTPEIMSYIHSIVGGKDTVRFFAQHARGKLWLQWAAATPEFASLFYPSSNVEPKVTHELARWFAQNYIADDELSDVALQIVAEANTSPGSDLLFELCRRLAGAEWPLPERLRRWLIIVTSSPESNHITSFLGSMLRRSSLTDDANTALFLFHYLTEPKVRPSRQMIFGVTFEAVSRESDAALSEIWKDVFRPALEHYAVRLLDIADHHLRRADLQLAISNQSDRLRPSDWRAAIEHLGFNESSGPLGFLIDVARECIDYLVEAEHPDGFARLDVWATSNIIILQRLALHGWTRRTDKSATEKLQWFLDSAWLNAYETRSEATYLITQVVPSAEYDAVAALIAGIVERSHDDEFAPRRAWSLLTAIDAARPDQENVKQALANLANAHPEVVDRLQDDSETEPSAWETAPSTNIQELHEEIDRDAALVGQALIACEAASSSFDDERRWDELTGAISATVQSWPTDGFALLDSVDSGHPQIDRAVLRGWSMSEPDTDLAPRILARIDALEITPILGYVTATLGGFAYAGSQPPNWFKYNESEQLARQCWEAIPPGSLSALTDSKDLVMEAINHPAGHLAAFWVDRVSHLWSIDRNRWDAIPPDIADNLAGMLDGDTKRAEAVEVVLGQNLVFLHQADKEWCRHFLLPRFDWSNEARAHRLWEGYLSHGSWTNELLADGFMDSMVAASVHQEKLLARRAHNLSGLLARIALDANLDPRGWLPNLITTGSPEGNAAWADAIGHELRTLDPDEVERQWDRWMHGYLIDRTASVPRRLDPREASAIAFWVLFLTDSMPAAIDLLLRSPTAGFVRRSLFFHELGDSQIERAPEEVARLVEHLLKATDASAIHLLMNLDPLYAKLKASAVSEATLRAIAEAAMRLGIELE